MGDPEDAPKPSTTAGEVFDRYGGFVMRTLRYLGVPDRDLPDASQNTFLVIHRKLAEYQGRSSLRTWLYGICRRVAAAYRRSEANVRESIVPDPPDAGSSPTQDAELERRRGEEFLRRVLLAMEPQKREVFVLYEIEGLSMTEVAQMVGCPVQTAYSRLHAARSDVFRAWHRVMVRSEAG